MGHLRKIQRGLDPECVRKAKQLALTNEIKAKAERGTEYLSSYEREILALSEEEED